jgi:hypothetical protein
MPPSGSHRWVRAPRTRCCVPCEPFRCSTDIAAPPADVAAVEDVLLRVSALAAAHPEIAELDCKALCAGPDGAVVLDGRIRVGAPPPDRPFPALDR